MSGDSGDVGSIPSILNLYKHLLPTSQKAPSGLTINPSSVVSALNSPPVSKELDIDRLRLPF